MALFVIAACTAVAEANDALADPDRPVASPGESFVTSGTCRGCHPSQYDSWHSSYHRTMTQVASLETVRAPIDGQIVDQAGYRMRLFEREGQVWVDMEVPSAVGSEAPQSRIERPLALVTGSHHMQVYWFASGQSRILGMLPFVYLLGVEGEEARWIPRPAIFLKPPVDEIDPELGLWNHGCIRCHVTDPRPGRVDEHQFDTAATEFGIACEQCHGPAAEHVRINRDPLRRYQQHLTDKPEPTIVNPAKLDPLRSTEVCGQCHGVYLFPTNRELNGFLANGFRYRPGDDLNDSRHILRRHHDLDLPLLQSILRKKPEIMDERFWSDGVVRVSGREYNGLLESPCFQTGELSCLSCHSMHKAADDRRSNSEWAVDQLGAGKGGDEACTRCHAELSADISAHTHHSPESSGSRCYNCHMPYTTWGLLKAIRSHTVENPSVQTSLSTGRPNACNQCHLDRSLGWSAKHLEEWYGVAGPKLSEEQSSVSAAVLWTLTGDAGQRALMAWSMGWDAAREASGTDWLPPYLVHLMLNDPYDAVRVVASRALRSLPGYGALRYDPMDPEEERQRAAQAAGARWLVEHRSRENEPRPGTLIHDNGIDGERFMSLASQRDDRVVYLRE
ncbi:ammonia-forming cytochrome c nitrite reductase subunit c552 [Myxococcota bacterium]|nr:ammonia-forming cytochrome c nitrite reductase subunit c552 [Myxococcota bacterium]